MHPETLRSRRRLYVLARAIVARHYRRRLTLAVVSRTLASSPRQVQRAYEQFGEMSFQEDLLAHRMAAAAQLLREQPGLAVRDVARLVGYRQAPHFAQAFRRTYGMPPARFRARARAHRAQAGAHPAQTDAHSAQAEAHCAQAGGHPANHFAQAGGHPAQAKAHPARAGAHPANHFAQAGERAPASCPAAATGASATIDSAPGSVRRMSVPPPGGRSAVTCPPCWSTT